MNLNSPTLSAITVDNYDSAEQEFADAGNDVSNTNCGTVVYSVVNAADDTSIDWVTVSLKPAATSDYIIKASPTDGLTPGAFNLKLVITSSEYSGKTAEVAFTVTVNSAKCVVSTFAAPATTTTSVTFIFKDVNTGENMAVTSTAIPAWT